MCIHYTHVDLFILIHNISFTKVFSMCSPTHSHNIQVFPMCSPTHSHYNIHSQPHSMTVRDRMRVVVVVVVVVALRLRWSHWACGGRTEAAVVTTTSQSEHRDWNHFRKPTNNMPGFPRTSLLSTNHRARLFGVAPMRNQDCSDSDSDSVQPPTP